MSNLTIITRTHSSLSATKIEYDQSGKIKKKQSCARLPGTSVVLENLFYTLPVRHKEFNKNIKKEYNKLLYLIQSYCLVSSGIKITCFNTVSGKCTKLITTNSKNTLKDNIIEIFGIHAINNLIIFEQCNEELSDEIKEEFKVLSNEENVFEIGGFISNCKNNFGRSSQDRQYLFINKRPCENQRVMKLINEVYRQYNQSQYPMFIINISLSKNLVDINVTPDKLKIFIKNENILLALLKTSLKNLYSSSEPNKVEDGKNEPETKKKVYNFQFYKASDNEEVESPTISKKRVNCDDSINSDENSESLAPKKNKTSSESQLFDLCPQFKQTKLNNIIKEKSSNEEENKEKFVLIKTISSKNEDKASKIPNILFQNNIGSNVHVKNSNSLNESYNDKKLFDLNDTLSSKIDLHFNKDFNADDSIIQSDCRIQVNLKKLGCNKLTSPNDHDLDLYESEAEVLSQPESLKITKDAIDTTILTEDDDESEKEDKGLKKKVEHHQIALKTKKKSSIEESPIKAIVKEDFSRNRKVKEINFSLDNLLKNPINNSQKTGLDANKYSSVKFKPKQFDSKEAESELDRYIQKEDFMKMEVCGQFNKGFIVTKLDHDLFIVDQHAADEIYNFEQLQITNKIDKQRLLQPHYLELSTDAEKLLIENEQLLEKAGYEMQVVKNRKAGTRVMLTSVPASKKQNKIFDSSDIDELLFILNENNISCCNESAENLNNLQKLHQIKPSSLRAMYASKACRKSIMIGDSLNKFEMKRVVTHLSEIVKPWNCPHGRPTLRHLINLELYRNISKE